MKIAPFLTVFALGLTGLVSSAGCSPAPMTTSTKGDAKGDDATGNDGNATNDPTSTNGSSGGTAPAPAPRATITGPLGVIAIDEQQVFFDTATARNASNVTGRMANSATLLKLAGTKQLPVLMTFEATKSGDHALPQTLVSALPAAAQQFIKTTFAATSQPQFTPAIKASGARRLVVIGAETDVCVLQTILGLRRAGFDVIAVDDGIFTEEVNTAPALRRLRQAGVVQMTTADAQALLTSGGASPAPAAGTTAAVPVIVRPLEMGILLQDLEGLGASDVSSSQKMVRLRELLLVSEWFRIPLFATDPAAASAALPANLRQIITRPISPLTSRPSTVTQLAVAGGHAGIGPLVTGLKSKVDVFLLEDALVGGDDTTDLEPLYGIGAVPSTYKTFYYEMIQSVDDAGWPSQQWVADGKARYYDETMAPEELPPLTVTP